MLFLNINSRPETSVSIKTKQPIPVEVEISNVTTELSKQSKTEKKGEKRHLQNPPKKRKPANNRYSTKSSNTRKSILKSHSSPMAMRDTKSPIRPNLNVSNDWGLDFFSKSPAHSLPAKSIPKSWKRRSDGTYLVKHPGFKIVVKENGRVQFKDDPDIAVKIIYPSPLAMKQILKEWYSNPRAFLEGKVELALKQFVNQDLDSLFMGSPIPLPAIAGPFNPDTAIIRMLGEDPFWAARLKFMKETRRVRYEMAKRVEQQAQRQARYQARTRLENVWSHVALSALERKKILFELWDESTEDANGIFIRRTVVGFIRENIPPSSPGAYSNRELEQLNSLRTSKKQFAPYTEK